MTPPVLPSGDGDSGTCCCQGQGAVARPRRQDRQRPGAGGLLRHRAHPLGNARRSLREQCTPACLYGRFCARSPQRHFENYLEIREKLSRHDYRFYSQTDTEAIVNLIDYYYKKYKMGPIDAIAKTLVRVRGSYALASCSALPGAGVHRQKG